MDTQNTGSPHARPNSIQSLDDLVVKYDLRSMIEEIEYEFDISVANQTLVDQKAISRFFNLGGDSDARN